MPKNRKRNTKTELQKTASVKMISPLWNTVIEKIEKFLEKENTHSTQLSNVRLKSQKLRLHSGTQRCTKSVENANFTNGVAEN